MTETELNELESAAKAATPGPWIEAEDDEDDYDSDIHRISTLDRCNHIPPRVEIAQLETGWSDEPFESEQQANLAFILAANPTVILDLIAELRQTRKERDWVISQAMEKADLCCAYKSCDYARDNNISDEACMACWREAAREATCNH